MCAVLYTLGLLLRSLLLRLARSSSRWSVATCSAARGPPSRYPGVEALPGWGAEGPAGGALCERGGPRGSSASRTCESRANENSATHPRIETYQKWEKLKRDEWAALNDAQGHAVKDMMRLPLQANTEITEILKELMAIFGLLGIVWKQGKEAPTAKKLITQTAPSRCGSGSTTKSSVYSTTAL